MFKWLKKRKEEDQARESGDVKQTIDEDAFGQLHVDYGLRHAFMESEPMSWQRYDGLYFHSGGPGAYFMVPSYEEYLRLFDKYKNIIREREYWSEYYFRHLG